jgi:hypothetical protein
MSTKPTALSLALEALTLAAECGGELHLGIYANAKEKLQEMVDELLEFDLKMSRDERAPEGDDYNELLTILLKPA